MEKAKPTIGLALSGTGSRLVFYVGFLEECRKQGLEFDYVAACSSGAIVAAAYACGTLDALKDIIFNMNKKTLYRHLKKGNGGLYSMEYFERLGYEKITKGLTFEEVRPHMAFVATDIEKGEQVIICMGDINRAAMVSCAMPGIIEPVKWGGRTLIDGGLLNIIPVDVVKSAGIDIAIGINMRGTRHMFTENQMNIKKVFNLVKKAFLFGYLEKVWGYMVSKDERDADFETPPGFFTTLGKSMDLAIQANKKDYSEELQCDLMITPDVSGYRFKDFDTFNPKLYEYGKEVAAEYISKMRQLMAEKQQALAVSETVI